MVVMLGTVFFRGGAGTGDLFASAGNGSRRADAIFPAHVATPYFGGTAKRSGPRVGGPRIAAVSCPCVQLLRLFQQTIRLMWPTRSSRATMDVCR